MVTMVEAASCLRIISGSRQYSRYLKHTQGEDKPLPYLLRHSYGRVQNDHTKHWKTMRSIAQIFITDLFSNQGCRVQDSAYMSLSASEAMVALLYIFQAKSHSVTPPSAIALQYTVDLKLGLILEGVIKLMRVFQVLTESGKSSGKMYAKGLKKLKAKCKGI